VNHKVNHRDVGADGDFADGDLDYSCIILGRKKSWNVSASSSPMRWRAAEGEYGKNSQLACRWRMFPRHCSVWWTFVEKSFAHLLGRIQWLGTFAPNNANLLTVAELLSNPSWQM
jgi:hypothetical protein